MFHFSGLGGSAFEAKDSAWVMEVLAIFEPIA
jgi:hypothetical protein